MSRDIKKALKKLIYEEQVDAIYFHTNKLAAEGIKQLVAIDKNILKNIDIVVFDQNLAFNFLEHKIPYVSQPLKKMGQKAITTLIDVIENKTEDITQISLKVKLDNY